mmetsp:Transcript_1778/g.2808  ORF Transcript_1778/g.2808 Transcript_1778/m.2808 type:complete len:315 (+) Transcript_1778:162-1106(+)
MGRPIVGKKRRGHVERREKRKEPTVVEFAKKTLLLRSTKTGAYGVELLRDIRKIRGPDHTLLFSKKNDDVRPFEAETRMEFFCNKNDCGMFLLASHSKKRPNNLTIGRIFDKQMLDMVEVGITNFKSVQEMLKKNPTATKAVDGQSAVIFQGEWTQSEELESLRSLLLDLFRPPSREMVDMTTLDHVCVCTAVEGKVYVRNYMVAYKGKERGDSETKASQIATTSVNGMKIPDLALLEMGPSIDMETRRHRQPSRELMKAALHQPRTPGTMKKVKNVTHDSLQGKLGRVHMKKQDMTKLVTRSRFKKALKRSVE